MKKIVILGCENSHANMFLNFCRDNPKYSDIEIIGVYSDDTQAAQTLSDTYGVKVMNTYDQAVGQVDGVIVTARHGDNHYKYAKPYIASGVPMFIDKPITVCEDDAIRLVQECQKAGVKLTGGSSCVHVDWVQALKKEHEENVDGKTLGGYVCCPINLQNPYGGFFFYAEHLVGIMSEIFGRYPKSVKAFKNQEKLTVVFRYQDFDVTGLYVENFNCYYAMRVSKTQLRGQQFPVAGDSDCFKQEFDEFYSLLKGGAQKISYQDFISTVFVMNAVNQSLESGKEIIVKDYTI